MGRHPDWVLELLLPNEHVQKEGGEFYACRATSVRTAGLPNPQKVLVKVALLRPRMRISLDQVPLAMEQPICYEYGFSTAALLVCSDEWRLKLGKDFLGVFIRVIAMDSPDSYLLRDGVPPLYASRNLALQARRFWSGITHGTKEMLLELRGITVFYEGGEAKVTGLTAGQRAILSKLGISLMGDVRGFRPRSSEIAI